MTTVTDRLSLFPCVVSDPCEIDRLRWFQTARYVECGLLDQLPQELPADPHVHLSTYFGVYTEDGEIQATARIVSDDIGLPMMKYHSLFPEAQASFDACRGTVSELSRLAVAGDAARRLNLSLLGREIIRFGADNPQASLLFASVSDSLRRILNRILQAEPQLAGPAIPQYADFAGVVSPIMMDIVKCIAALRQRDDARSRFFFEDLVIDLTDADAKAPAQAVPLAAAGG